MVEGGRRGWKVVKGEEGGEIKWKVVEGCGRLLVKGGGRW